MEQKKDNKDFLNYNSPDPSSLTTQQLWREIASLKELIFSKLEAVEKAVEVAHEDFVRFPTDIQEEVGSLKEIVYEKIRSSNELKIEKFSNVEKRFDLIEQVRVEQKKDTMTAVDAALKAAKEAVSEQNNSNTVAIAKSESSTAKQIDQQALLLTTATKGLEDKIGDVKERLTKIEGVVSGFESVRAKVNGLQSGADEVKGKSAGIAQFIGWIIAAIAVIAFILKNLSVK